MKERQLRQYEIKFMFIIIYTSVNLVVDVNSNSQE